MADETTTSTTSDQQLSQIINQLLAGKTAQPAVDPNTGPSSRDGRGILSLLGEGLGGGSQYGTTAEREQGGLSALGALGSRMLQTSDWSATPHTFGSILGQGLDAARGNLGHTQAVSAARQYATQQLAHQQQEDQINRLKEALPYLQLMQNREAIKGMPGSLLGGNTTGSIGAVGNGPPDPNSPAGQVATRTAAFWSSQGYTPEQVAGIMAGGPGAESSFNPGAKGDGGDSHGLYQHQGSRWAEMVKRYGPNPTEAQQHEFAAWEISPQGTHAAVGAALKQAKTPQEAAAIWTKGFERPKNADAQAAARAGVAGRYLGYGAAPTKAGAPAATPAAPGQAAMPPPEPPLLAGTAQAAGDVGAPTGTVIPPSPPGSDATVAEIEAGRASSPARTGAQPGAVVTAQAGGQPPDPNSFEAYRLAHPIAPPAPEQRMLFDAGLTPEQQKAHDTQLRALEVQYQAARAKGDPTAAAAAQEKLVTLETATSTLRENARKLAVEKQAEYFKDQDKQRFDAWTAQRAQQNKQAEADQKLQNDLVLKDKEGEISRLNTREGSFVESNKIIRDTLGKEAVAAAGKMQSLEGLRALSDNVGDNNATLQSLANIKYGGTTLLNHLTNAGIVGKGDAGPIQMLQNGISGAITELRAGIQMGALSDRDLSFIESMGPSLYEDRATRSAVISYLQQAARAKMRFNTIYNEQMARPNANSGDALEKTREIMDTKHPIVPQMPADIYAHRRDPDPAWQTRVAEWAQDNNVKPRTLYRAPGGGLKLVPDPGTPGGG